MERTAVGPPAMRWRLNRSSLHRVCICAGLLIGTTAGAFMPTPKTDHGAAATGLHPVISAPPQELGHGLRMC